MLRSVFCEYSLMKNRFAGCVTAALTMALLFSATHVSAEVIPDEQVRLDLGTSTNQVRVPGDPRVGAVFSDTATVYASKPPGILGMKTAKPGEIFSATNPYAIGCNSTGDPACAGYAKRFISAKYPYCSPKSSVICLKSFWAILPDGKRVEATFIKELDPGTPVPFLDEPRYGIPRTAGDSIFEFRDASGAPVITHNGGSLFALRSSLIGVLGSGAYDFEGAIFAISLVNNQSKKLVFKGFSPGETGAGYGYNWDPAVVTNCAVIGVGVCGVPFTLPTDVRFGVEMQSTVFPIKWVHGRLESPIVKSNYNGKIYSISVEAKPTKIPMLSGVARYSQVTPTLQKRYSDAIELDQKSTKGVSRIDDLSPTQGDFSLAALKDWLEYLPDKAQALPTAWSIRTISVSDLVNTKFPTKCINLDENFAGLVTTNATAYSSGPPKFDAATGTLEYQVAAPHFEKDGVTPFKGSYDLAIRSDVARCIYGFTDAPIQASVSVLSSGSEQKIATTSFKEEAGWLNFSAKNFEFSTPKVLVRMSQKNPSSQAQLPAAKPSAAVKTSSITCIKGKVKKKVTGAPPRCPAGYRKG